MFTGIIETTARIEQTSPTGLVLQRPAEFTGLAVGDSIAVSGVCLTITELSDNTMAFDVVSETWQKTNLGTRKAGDSVNLERALAASGRFDGHLVQGHIEGTATVESVPQLDTQFQLTISLPANIAHLVVPKGSIAIDGVSLTVASKENLQCTIALVPHTLAITTLGTLAVGDTVNIETDIVGRYVYQFTTMTA